MEGENYDNWPEWLWEAAWKNETISTSLAQRVSKELAERDAEIERLREENGDLRTQRNYLVGQVEHKEREKDELRKMIRMWQNSLKPTLKVKQELRNQLAAKDAMLAAATEMAKSVVQASADIEADLNDMAYTVVKVPRDNWSKAQKQAYTRCAAYIKNAAAQAAGWLPQEDENH